MRIAAFSDVGGYDESFSHNEDAELDHRLNVAGFHTDGISSAALGTEGDAFAEELRHMHRGAPKPARSVMAELQAAYLAALAPFLSSRAPAQRDPWVTLSRETLLVVEHQVRNFLNSLLMNAAVLSLHTGHEGRDPVLEQIESDGQRCLDVVRQLLHPPG